MTKKEEIIIYCAIVLALTLVATLLIGIGATASLVLIN